MEPCACECDEGFEVGFELFVSGGEAAEVLESGEAAFDAITLFVQCFVVLALLLAVAFGWDDSDPSHACDVLNDGIAVVTLICEHRLGLALCQQVDGLGAVMDLAGGYGEVHWQTELIGKQVDLGR